jgi:hypothetical protein
MGGGGGGGKRKKTLLKELLVKRQERKTMWTVRLPGMSIQELERVWRVRYGPKPAQRASLPTTTAVVPSTPSGSTGGKTFMDSFLTDMDVDDDLDAEGEDEDEDEDEEAMIEELAAIEAEELCDEDDAGSDTTEPGSDEEEDWEQL